MRKKIILGSRGSLLALAQSEKIKKQLQELNPELDIEIKVIMTSGDKDLVSNWENSNTSLKSFFTKEIERDLLEGKIDLAVHSMKDMPIISPEGLICGAIPAREDNRDVFVSFKYKNIQELPPKAVVGTSSLRRTSALNELRPDLEIKHLRGNIHTRLRKLEEGDYDGIILAAAGLKRVGLEEKITQYFKAEEMMPAPAQGALHIQCREGDREILEILKGIHDKSVEEIVLIEREFSKIFDGGCHTPMGCSGEINGDKILLKGSYWKNDKIYRSEVLGKREKGIEIAGILAEKIREMMKGER
ncbi:MAG: hydroxymethylbilane synthase [Fusobacteriaceae bacterium]